MTTNERFSSKLRSDSHSGLHRTRSQRGSALSIDDQSEDTLLRTTFMGPSDGNCFGNCYRMCTHIPPTQQTMKEELII